jgi:Ni,Fe-hydrogenase III small subunit
MRRTLLLSLFRPALTERAPRPGDEVLAEVAAKVDRAARRRLGRSLAIREVDAGSCNGCELEIHALNNAFYDLERFGIRFVASPRHADVLLVTGPVTKNMQEALWRTYQATPDPKWVVAVGDCAVDGGLFAGSYAVRGGCREWSRSICTSAAARPGPCNCSKACSPCSRRLLKRAACGSSTSGRRPQRRVSAEKSARVSAQSDFRNSIRSRFAPPPMRSPKVRS